MNNNIEDTALNIIRMTHDVIEQLDRENTTRSLLKLPRINYDPIHAEGLCACCRGEKSLQKNIVNWIKTFYLNTTQFVR